MSEGGIDGRTQQKRGEARCRGESETFCDLRGIGRGSCPGVWDWWWRLAAACRADGQQHGEYFACVAAAGVVACEGDKAGDEHPGHVERAGGRGQQRGCREHRWPCRVPGGWWRVGGRGELGW